MISVIMTTYNAGRTVKKALDSLLPVLDELGVGYEIVATDNESQDNTVEILRRFDARVRVMRCTRGLGRHVAVGMSKGNYLLFYDADAHANRDLLFNFLQAIIKNKIDFSLAHSGVYLISRKCYSLTGGFMNLNFGEDVHFWARAFTMCKSIYYPVRVACNAPRIYSVRGYRGEYRYVRNPLRFIFREVKNEVHRLRGLALRPGELIPAIKSGDPLMISGILLLSPLSNILGSKISKDFSNLELVYLQELRNMGNIEDITYDGKYIVQDIYFVKDWYSIFKEFLKRLRSYEPKVIEHRYARIIYTPPDLDLCPP